MKRTVLLLSIVSFLLCLQSCGLNDFILFSIKRDLHFVSVMLVCLFNQKFLFLFGWAFTIKFLIFSLFVCLFNQKFILCSLSLFVCLLGSWSRAANLRAPEFFWSTNCRNWKSGRENRGLSSIRILSRSRMSSPGKDLQSKSWRRMVYYIDVKISCKIFCNIEENTLLVEKIRKSGLIFF